MTGILFTEYFVRLKLKLRFLCDVEERKQIKCAYEQKGKFDLQAL